MHDIQNRSDIQSLIDRFYEKVVADAILGPVFNDIARVDWPHHLPVMYDFWSFLLLGTDTYTGNPIEKHHALHRLTPLTNAMFDRWVELFHATVDELFSGETATSAKFRAYAIAETWKPKFDGPFSG